MVKSLLLLLVLPAVMGSVASRAGAVDGTGESPSLHWVPLPDPPVSLISWDLDGEGIAGLGKDGSLLRWRGEDWERVDGPPPGVDALPTRIATGPDGALWVAGSHRSLVFRWDGEWGERETLPTGYVHGIGFDDEGRAWAAGLHGYLAHRTEEGWVLLESPALDTTSEYNFGSIRFDRDGVGWAGTGRGLIVRVEDEQVTRLELELRLGAHVSIDRDGRPLLAANGAVRRMDEDGYPVVLDRPATFAHRDDGGWWLLEQGQVQWLGDEGHQVQLQLPSAAPPRALRRTAGGALVVEDSLQRLFVSRPGSAPVLRDVAEEWNLASASDRRGAAAADVDGDGLEDLVLCGADGSLRLLLQREGGFDDATERWRLELTPRDHYFALCDLDGDGRADLVARESEDEERLGRLRYLRALGGWFADVSATLPEERPHPVTKGTGRLTCVDVDADGDRDLLLAVGASINPAGANVALYENTGYGQLTPVPLPVRGLGQGSAWVQEVLAGDMDADGLTDFVLLNLWNRGHDLFAGRADHGLEDRTRGSGLDAVYAAPERGWLVTLDDDPYLDLLTVDMQDLPRAWRGSADLRLVEVTEAWGLDRLRVWFQADRVGAALGDLDGDGQPDLLLTNPRDGFQLVLGTPEGPFVDRTDALPRGVEGIIDLVTLDLGGDGDRDVLVLREGTDLLLENLSDPVPLAAEASPRRTATSVLGAVARRVSWSRPWPDLLLVLLLVLPWLVAHGVVRHQGSGLLLGRVSMALVLVAGLLAAHLALAELSLVWRLPPALASPLLAVLAVGLEVAAERRRQARRIAGYRLETRIGAGGMGVVYRAREPQSGRKVALKLVNPELLSNEEDRELFRREARLGARLDDPRVVRILGYGEWTVIEGGRQRPTAYLVMELLDGVSLRELLERGGPLEVGQACAVAREVALALETIHEVGIVHRDIKPENLMLVPPDQLKVMDFGAARPVGHTTHSARQVLGTLAYLAPEQGRGLAPDVRSDLYSVGVVLYELLSGHRPFVAEDLVRLLSRVLYDDPPPLRPQRPEIPVEVERIALRALAKEPADRFDSAAELAVALEPFAGAVPRVGPTRRTTTAIETRPGDVSTAGSSSSQVLWHVLRSWWIWSRTGGRMGLMAFAESLLAHAAREEEKSSSATTLEPGASRSTDTPTETMPGREWSGPDERPREEEP